MMAPLPGAWPERPGSATLPFFGVVPLLVDDKARGCPSKAWSRMRAALVGWTCPQHCCPCASGVVRRGWGLHVLEMQTLPGFLIGLAHPAHARTTGLIVQHEWQNFEERARC